MADPTPDGIATALFAPGFERDGPSVSNLSDPIADTPMVVTLDQLRPYERDPRVTRNPAYEDIKASVRVRGLDAPPSITRRPGEEHYIIRNGGNTRLSILRELWTETREERFFRLACRFRPWPERGEIVALTGHLAENELRGGLTFIERALGVEMARSLYELETGGQAISQSELARRLSADGFPVQQSHISRMQEAVRYLLPAIPTLLYGGLGRHQVERLSVLRNACARVWDRRAAGKSLPLDFAALFQDILSQFDTTPDLLASRRLQDELVGQMAELLGADYDALTLEIDDGEVRQRVLTSVPTPAATAQPPLPAAHAARPMPPPQPAIDQAGSKKSNQVQTHVHDAPDRTPGPASTPMDVAGTGLSSRGDAPGAFLQEHIASPAATTERLQTIQHLVAEKMGDPSPSFEADVLRSIPVQAGGLYPISDVWYIDPGLNAPDRLRVHIGQFAQEIAEEVSAAGHVQPCDSGLGFVCLVEGNARSMEPRSRAVLTLLHALSASPTPSAALEAARLAADLAQLLHGHGGELPRLSDTSLVKLFRLLRLARRLLDLGASTAFADGGAQVDA